jgi:hypothetical protein
MEGTPRNHSASKEAKASARPSVLKVKSTIHLTPEASQRLDIHVTMMGARRSALVEKLVNEHLRRYVVSDRGGVKSLRRIACPPASPRK